MSRDWLSDPWTLRLPPVQFTRLMVRSLVSAMRLPPGFTSYLHWNPPEPQQVSAPEPSGTSTRYLHRNPPEPHGLSAPEPSGTLNRYLHRNPPEPHQVSAPEPSGTSTGICTETLQNLTRALRNLTRYLHRNPPEPHQVSAPEPSGTLRNLARNLVLKLHRIAPELIWAKDPIAKFCCWGKTENNIRCS